MKCPGSSSCETGQLWHPIKAERVSKAENAKVDRKG